MLPGTLSEERRGRVLMTVDAVGGVWRYAADLARGLGDIGIEVVLAGLGPAPGRDRVAELRGLNGVELVWLDAPLDWMVDDPAALDGVGPAIAEAAYRHGCDLVQVNVPSQAAGIGGALPVVAVHHSCVVTWWHAVKAGPLPEAWDWQRRLNRRGLDAVDAVVAPTWSHAKAVQRLYGAVPELEVVPNASLPDTREAVKKPLVFAAGRWWDEGKNGGVLDAAAVRLAWPVVMAGATEGPNGARFPIAHARALGEISADAVRGHMAEAAIVACPSLYEPFGLTALEAAHAGAALVLSDIPTFRELWSGAAVFADPRDPEAFAAALSSLALDAARRQELGERARERAGRFTLTAQATAMAGLYDAVLAARSRPRAAE